MKKQAFIISTVISSLFLAGLALAAPTSTYVQNLFITGLSSPGSPCLVAGTNGLIATSSCGGTAEVTIGGITSSTFQLLSGHLGITATGTIGLATTSVTAASYTNTNLTVDAYGRITSASNGTAGSGSGSVSTSSPITANNFPFWTAASGTLSGTSTLTVSGTSLFAGGTFNASGTITQNGVSVLTTSTALVVGNFASPNISQWTNDANYLTSLSGALLAANNLSDLTVTSTARTNIGFSAGSNLTLSALGVFAVTSTPVFSITSSTGLTFTNGTSSGNLQTATLRTTGAINASSTITVDGVLDSRAGFTFVNATGTGNLQTGTFKATGAILASSTITADGVVDARAGLTTTNATATGNIQTATFKATGAVNASSTVTVSGAATFQSTIAGQATSTFMGRVGVGTTTPSSTIHIQGAASQTTDILKISSSSNSDFITVSATGTTAFDDGITGTSTIQFGAPSQPACHISYSFIATTTPVYWWFEASTTIAMRTSTSSCP